MNSFEEIVAMVDPYDHVSGTIPRIYIAGPIAANLKTAACSKAVIEARVGIAVSAYFELVKKGWNPYLTHSLVPYGIELDWYAAYDTVLPMDIAWLKMCQALCVLPNGEDSPGVILECEIAEKYNIPIYDDVEAVPTYEPRARYIERILPECI